MTAVVLVWVGAILALVGFCCQAQAPVEAKTRTRAVDLLVQASGAVGWGVFLSVSPGPEVIFFGCIVWILVLARRELARAQKYRFFPGLFARIAVMALVVALAVALPVKGKGGRLGPLAKTEMSLDELSKEVRIYGFPRFEGGEKVVRVSSASPSWRELARDIEAQTKRKVRIGGCATGMSFLSGPSPMYLEVE